MKWLIAPLLLLVSACGREAEAAELPKCSFQGDVTKLLRTTATKNADGSVDLTVTWDAAPPPDATFVPPESVSGVRTPFGDEGVEASVVGPRTIKVRWPGGRATTAKPMLVLNPTGYAAPCRQLPPNGLPYYILGLELAPTKGGVELRSAHGSSFVEG